MTTIYPMPLTGDDMFKALREAGILAEVGYVRRVTITLKPRSIVTIEIEQEADDRLLDLLPALAEVDPE